MELRKKVKYLGEELYITLIIDKESGFCQCYINENEFNTNKNTYMYDSNIAYYDDYIDFIKNVVDYYMRNKIDDNIILVKELEQWDGVIK